MNCSLLYFAMSAIHQYSFHVQLCENVLVCDLQCIANNIILIQAIYMYMYVHSPCAVLLHEICGGSFPSEMVERLCLGRKIITKLYFVFQTTYMKIPCISSLV